MTPEQERAYQEQARRAAEGMRRAREAPRYTGPTVNVAEYWRPSHRHKWRLGATRVNVPDVHPEYDRLPATMRWEADGTEHASVPYDWEIWTPPRTTYVLPGLPMADHPKGAKVEGYNWQKIEELANR